MKMHSVTSSNIAAVGHEGRHLRIQFHSGKTHEYEDVPPEIHEQMLKADSVGKFFHAHVRNGFASKEIKDE